MQQLFNYSGDATFLPGGSLYPNPKEPSLFLSLAPQVDFYVPLRKKARVIAPFSFEKAILEAKTPVSIEVLPDECLFEVFRRLSGGGERSRCASVNKKWLFLLSSIRKTEFCTKEVVEKDDKSNESDDSTDSDGYLSRSLEGNKATDIRLAAISIGTSHRRGLGKLSIRGSKATIGLTNLGLKTIARSCPSLKSLSLWNVSSISDEGLCAIANECPLLETLDLCHCPKITDKSLLAIAMKSPNLKYVSIESCCNVGNKSLQAFGTFCRGLSSVTINKCPLVSDQGISGFMLSASLSLTKLKLQSLNIGDMSLAVIGHYGKALTDLSLNGLQNVGERGFWVMGNANGLHALKSFTINSCQGVTDLGLEAISKGCPNLKQFSLFKCVLLSDNGLVAFAKSATSLESLKLEECHRITQFGFFGVINFGLKLKAFAITNCLGYKEFVVGFPTMKQCASMQNVSIRNCTGFGNVSMSILGKLCPNLHNVEFIGLSGITDEGLIPLMEKNESGLSKINLSGCVNLTDKVVFVISDLHGLTLENLNLDGCKHVTDASLVNIAENCSLLSELDVSKCKITDSGIAELARGCQISLQIFSISGCTFVSDRSLSDFLEMGQTLVGLNIQHCKGISTKAVDVLMERLWRCNILN